jgi:hypothetical protein
MSDDDIYTSTNIPRGAPPYAAEDTRQAYLFAGWEEVEVRPTNAGQKVLARRWIATDSTSVGAHAVAGGEPTDGP